MQSSQVIILVSVLFGLGGLLLGFLLGSAWANRQHRLVEPVQPDGEVEEDEAEAEVEAKPIPASQLLPVIEDHPQPLQTPTEAAPPVPPVAQPAPQPIPMVITPLVAAPVETRPAALANQPKAPTHPKGPMSIIDQVNEIFDEMIEGTPLAERTIHLVQDPTLGVTVQVGSEKFDSIDSVPDEEIRTALKAAVKKWEDR